MECMKDLEKMLEKQIETIVAKGDITPVELENVYRAVDVIKDLYTIEAMKGPAEGYSQTGPNWNGNSYGGNSYGGRWMTPEERFARGGYSGQYYDQNTHGGMSYEDGRNRDSMGRYSGQMEYDGYSGRRGRY